MPDPIEVDIRFRADGSIDTDYYIKKGLGERSSAAHKLVSELPANVTTATRFAAKARRALHHWFVKGRLLWSYQSAANGPTPS
ncbi:MAG: hypothetical protein ABJN26_00345 [Stappiaceae bacterium]